jgi:hypothetical protein
MTEVAVRDNTSMIGSFDPTDENVLRYLGLSPSDARSHAVVAVCRRYGLDPLMKHVVLIPGGGIYVTRDGLLHVAHESSQLNGIVVEQEPALSEDGTEWVARVSVHRKDMDFPFTFPGRYPVRGGNTKYAPEMALKAAEAHALRRAFNVTGLPTEDEQRPAEATPTQQRVTAADILTAKAGAAPQQPADDAPPASINEAQLTKLHTVFTSIGWTDRDDRLRAASAILACPVASSKDLTKDQAIRLIDTLEQVAAQADPAEALTQMLAEIREQGVQDAEIVEDGS